MSLEGAAQFDYEQERKEKVILTGGTEGIGRAIALELAEQKHDLVICARTKEGLEKLKLESKIEGTQLDLGDTDKIEDFIKQSSEKMKGTTVLILNAAVPGVREQDDYTFRVNRDAQKLLVESAADLLRESSGRIVFLSSPQVENPIDDNLAYGQAKKEVNNWLKEFSSKKDNKNVHIFSVNPGSVDTRMHAEAVRYGSDEVKQRSIQARTEGKLRDPKLVGRIISKMSLGGKRFNPETNNYDIPIANNEIVVISDENIEFEKTLVSKESATKT